MATGIGNLGNIVEDFTNSLNQIFGSSTSKNSGEKGSTSQLFNSQVGGSVLLEKDKWIGNGGPNKKKVRYGFAVLTLDDVRASSGPGDPTQNSSRLSESGPYYLDIPPQSIKQKEIFANQITATRKGVVVESEGVVFRDIVIQGTTGIMPGKRGGANNLQSNLFTNPTEAPNASQGVNANTGLSNEPSTKNISGYEEFLRLRQFFLKYSADKVKSDGNRFLIFINEKDNQTLIVEPLDFTMTRDAKSPLTYNYTIVLRGIGDLNAIFKRETPGAAGAEGVLGFLEDAGAVSANITATVQQGRATLNQSVRLLSRISQAADQTINGPLRQIQFATEDLKDGISTVLALPEVLVRNTDQAILNIRENLNDIENQLGFGAFQSAAVPPKPKPGEALAAGTSTDRQQIAQSFSKTREVLNRIETDEQVPIPRATLQDTRNKLEAINNDLADFVGLGDSSYDSIKGRVSTISPDPLKVVSDEEFILLGQLNQISESLNLALASNVLFQPDAELAFESASSQFQNENIPEDQRITIRKPNSVREVRIQQNDTLERIAQRELGSAIRWVELVVLNNLKPPYISAAGGDNIKKPGDVILVGVQ
ncbi:MAG: hypothetical protein GWN01_00785 [Nitrosopumilaceae archaeon]|nr:hypothetical protein [Nitrosopumilaceae archaeon]NIU85886.1 hypothetical protein [Nitrosopumilaceae archaeon]NIX60119.1 hypothetical protein [Nitrosopumilaceae archaeon]